MARYGYKIRPFNRTAFSTGSDFGTAATAEEMFNKIKDRYRFLTREWKLALNA